MALKYQRILLKISGEALGGEKGMGFDEPTMDAICGGVKKAHELGVQIGIVVGGGNFWRGRSSGKMERTLADKIGMLATVMNALAVKAPSMEQLTKNLSGGNQQKVVVAKWLATNADIIILDEPTRGIDIGAKYEIYLIMNRLVKEGKSIIMISSEMPELIGMSDRIIVMHQGSVSGELTKEEVSQERILEMASGM